MPSLKTLISLAVAGAATFLGARAQCVQNAGYVGAFDATTGTFVGAIARGLGGSGIFTLDTTGNSSNYLAVATFSNVCNDGGPVFIQILSPVDPAANYISLVAGLTSCSTAFFSGPAPWAAIAASDGFPHGQFTTPGTTRTTLQGGYFSLNTFCGECMTFALGTAVGRQVLLPSWKDPDSTVHASLPVVQDYTFGRLLATPNPTAYSQANSNARVQQVYLSIFI